MWNLTWTLYINRLGVDYFNNGSINSNRQIFDALQPIAFIREITQRLIRQHWVAHPHFTPGSRDESRVSRHEEFLRVVVAHDEWRERVLQCPRGIVRFRSNSDWLEWNLVLGRDQGIAGDKILWDVFAFLQLCDCSKIADFTMIFHLVFLEVCNGTQTRVCVRFSKVMLSFGYIAWKNNCAKV